MKSDRHSSRRKEKKSEMLDVRLPFGMKQNLIRTAKKNGETVSQAVRGMIADYIERTDAATTQTETRLVPMTIQRNPRKTVAAFGSAVAAALFFSALPATTEDTAEPQPINVPEIVYPNAMIEMEISGTCEAKFDISKEGLPEDITVTCSNQGFVEAATSATKTLRFKPKLVDGKPVVQKGVTYPYWFRIEPN